MRDGRKQKMALVTYQHWFYAPHATSAWCVGRLQALGFTWTKGAWKPPSQEVFVQRVTQKVFTS